MRPVDMLWLATLSTQQAYGLDVEAAARDLEDRLGGREPDLVMVFVSHHHAPILRTTAAFLLRRFERAVIVGVTGSGVIGGGREVEGAPAVAMVGACLPGVEIAPFHVSPAEVQYLATHPGNWRERLPVPPGARPTFLLFPEPFTCDGEKLIGSLDAAWPGSVKLGGLASGARHPGQNKLLLDRALHDRGAVGVALWGDLAVEAVVAQGGAPVGRALAITSTHEGLVTGLEDRPALVVLEELVAQLSGVERETFVGAPLAGLASSAAGPFVLRNVTGVDRRRRAVGVAGGPQVGQHLCFHRRTPDTARRELTALLQGVRPSAGALLVSCIARGEGFFGARDHDVRLVHDHLGEIAVGGFFANGELGPVGDRTWLHGYTSVLALFRPHGPGGGGAR